jgi:polyribonucleotide nucleotidyltransferase
MGLVKEGDDYVVLTDILGDEDHLGDMDFKVAGTATGITALQMDIKVKGITFAIMEQALAQARDARMAVLNVMVDAIAEPRTELSDYAPRLVSVKINPEKIGEVIGPGGKIIRKIQEETESKIDISDDGTIVITGESKDGVEKAAETIRAMTTELEVGAIFTGTVSRIMNAGVFVNLPDGRREGLVRMGELAEDYVERAEDVADVGDEVMVMVIEIDYQGRVNLSRRAVLEGSSPADRAGSGRGERSERGGYNRGRGPSSDRRSGPPRGGRGPRRDDRDRAPVASDRAPAATESEGDRSSQPDSSQDDSQGKTPESSGRKW